MTLAAFNYHNPVELQFGAGSLARLPAIVQSLGGRRVLVVGDPGVLQAGLVGRVTQVLSAADIPHDVFTDIKSDPEVRSVDLGVAMAKQKGADMVVGIGGGSALDAAKAIALMITNEGNIRDFFGIDKVKRAGAPVIAIPTTGGTGSEVTVWSVLSDTENDLKVNIGSPFNYARVAILDPELTRSLPAHVTAATGMDALTHAVESYVNKSCHPMAEAVAEKAIRLIADNLRVAVAQGDHMEARGNMLIASSLAGMSFNRIRLGLVHAFALPLGNKFHIPHGLVNGIMLPAVMRFNLPGNLQKYAKIAELFGERIEGLSLREAAERSVHAVQQLKFDIGLTQTLADFGVTEAAFEAVIDETLTSGNIAINPRLPTRNDLAHMLQCGMRGTV
ncbi:iron-containing alcohol dehydrogenase [Herbaspirillum rhizosphaerae]|uniref:iron-containing alcohol dehydrogenase n=1 Tax=Herbaspirillum rhizosphaerae TaxID=346179 RepID=UPI00067C9B29|nr:iron-containing alcohol dehydrogenase [Herbaspirillum rhizosphaerae]